MKKSLLLLASLLAIASAQAELPRILVLGDSISIGYEPFLEKKLEGKAVCQQLGDVAKASVNLDVPAGANGGNSERCLATIRSAREKGGVSSDFLLLNCGLHDIKTNKVNGLPQIALPQYEQNLRDLLTEAKKIGLRVVWVTTTPVIDEVHNQNIDRFVRYEKDVEAYNAAAQKVMEEAGVPVIDLHAFSQKEIPGQYKDHVHYTPEAAEKQAAFLAAALAPLLTSAPQTP